MNSELLLRYDIIAGLLARPVIPPWSTKIRYLACIGDESRLDKKKETYIVPANPFLVPPITLKLANVQIIIPKRNVLEAKMNEAYRRSLSSSASAVNVEKANMQILSRNLMIGILKFRPANLYSRYE